MAEHDAQVTAETLVFARTPHGVVKVLAGERVPDDVFPGELQRLTRAGSVIMTEAEVETDPGHVPDDAVQPAPTPQPRTRRTRKAPGA